MPVGSWKNTVYGLALPVLGKRCEWKQNDDALSKVLHRHHAVGACIQRFEAGQLTECHAVGYAALEPEKRPVTAQTVFRTASIAKMVSALLVFRLQTLGKLNVQEELSDLLGFSVRSPYHPDAPVTLGMALSHTSSIVDSPAYFDSFSQPQRLQTLLEDPAAWSTAVPGTCFRYSNLAAGLVGCVLEKRFGESFEQLAQKELFAPLGVRATFDLSALKAEETADSYRVLPAAKAFDAPKRINAAVPLEEPDAQHHYLLASGSLFVTAEALARLALTAWNGADGFLNAECLALMQTPLKGWPEQSIKMEHGMGLLKLENASVCPKAVWGHQGFAYGAVNGVFFDQKGSGFAALNSGVSEQRVGHLALINRDLIRLWMGDGKA